VTVQISILVLLFLPWDGIIHPEKAFLSYL